MMSVLGVVVSCREINCAIQGRGYHYLNLAVSAGRYHNTCAGRKIKKVVLKDGHFILKDVR